MKIIRFHQLLQSSAICHSASASTGSRADSFVLMPSRRDPNDIELATSRQIRYRPVDMVSRQQLLQRLRIDRIRNLGIINLIEDNRHFEHVTVGDSVLFRFEKEFPDDLNIRICSSSRRELSELVRFLKDGDCHFLGIEDWMVPFVTRNRTILTKNRTRKFYLPDDMDIGKPKSHVVPLRPEDAAIVNANWPYRNDTSLEFIQGLISLGTSGAVYIDNQAVAWGMLHPDGSMGFMFVQEEYRKRGYAHDITAHLIKLTRDRGGIPFLYTAEDNHNVIGIVKKYGLREAEHVSMLILS